jgi:TolA-binding protein
VHILTKFLVIMAAVLAVLLSGLTIAYSSNAQRLREAVDNERKSAEAAKAAAGEVTAQAAAERESLNKKIEDLNASLGSIRQTISQLQGDNAQLLSDKKRLELDGASYQARIDQFIALSEAHAKLDEARAKELEELRVKQLSYARKEIELGDRINDLAGQLEVSQETSRALQEQLVSARQDLDRAKGGGVADASGLKKAPATFRGRITNVTKDDATGTTLVTINAGSNDRLTEKMELNIVRDGFVAKVVLTRVDLNTAIGTVNFLGRDVSVQVNDLVMPTL